jgi:hypothetical protein
MFMSIYCFIMFIVLLVVLKVPTFKYIEFYYYVHEHGIC